MENFVRLTTGHLLLRDLQPEDLPSHHALLSDATAMYYLPDIKTNSLAESKRNLDEATAEISSPKRRLYFFRMEELSTGNLVGQIGYTVNTFTPLGTLVDLGYFSLPSFWNKGYTSEALREVLRFAFEENGVFRVSTGCIRDNRGSERVMQKCGMIKEAELRARVWHDGRIKDRVCYRLLREEYLALKQARMADGG